jgi:hypothetical protein
MFFYGIKENLVSMIIELSKSWFLTLLILFQLAF